MSRTVKEQPSEHITSTPRELARWYGVLLEEEFGVAFAFFDITTSEHVAPSKAPSKHEMPTGSSGSSFELPKLTDAPRVAVPDQIDPMLFHEVTRTSQAKVISRGEFYRLAFPCYDGVEPRLVAVADYRSSAQSPAERDRESSMLERWVQAVREKLRLASRFGHRPRKHRAAPAPSSTAPVASTAPWETLLQIDQTIRGLRAGRSLERTIRDVLANARDVLQVDLIAWAPRDRKAVVRLGDMDMGADQICDLGEQLVRVADPTDLGPRLFEEFGKLPFSSAFPGVRSLMAFPIIDHALVGWILAANRKGGESFRKADAVLLTPFAGLIEFYHRSSARHEELKDLLVGFTRSLAAAIDAKDPSTFGHSERVARVALELGRELNLTAEDLGDVYLAGLLHDIGKIGVRDEVLCKPGPLTPTEQEHLRQHVTTGFSIISDLKQIRTLSMGVLYHHERWDGKGYPHGLIGEDIPLYGRIVAVADAYDAMAAARPYRAAMAPDQVEKILHDGAGTQWDPNIIDAFMRCKEKIHAVRQRGVGESLRVAVDGAIRQRTIKTALGATRPDEAKPHPRRSPFEWNDATRIK